MSVDFFRKNLKFLRETKNLKQKDLQEIVKKSNSAVSNWEKNKATPSIPDIILLANFLNVDITAFLTKDLSQEDREPEPEPRPTTQDNIQVLEYASDSLIETGTMHMPALEVPHYAVRVTTSALSPIIEQGDTIIMRRVEGAPFRKDAIYLLQCSGDPPILRRVRRLSERSELELHTSQNYFPPRRIHPSEVVEAFLVVLRITAHRLGE